MLGHFQRSECHCIIALFPLLKEMVHPQVIQDVDEFVSQVQVSIWQGL